MACTFLATLLHRRRVSWLWPGIKADASFSEPLPPAFLGCPLFGSNILAGSKKRGPEYFYSEASKRLNHPSVWVYYFMGQPVASVSGANLVQDVLSREFDTLGSLPNDDTNQTKMAIFGSNNVMFERNQEQHAFLRRLVGSGMNSPEALRQALPTMEQTANESITQLLQQSGPVKMENICTEYTMEIVRKQLLGLDELSREERVILREKLSTWLSALYSLLLNIGPPSFIVKRSKPYKARLYIEAKLEEKIDSLLKNGPDSSTLSEMVFAVDEDGNERKLTREQVIENALVLVSAGSETSASTLTLAMLLLGLHPDAYTKLVEEQMHVQSEHGDALSLQMFDKECPYLDAVVKEALRLGAVTGGFPRRARVTTVIGGKQVPKGWPVFANIRLTHQLDPVTRLPDDSHMNVKKGFRPERWLSSETIPSDFIPFGAGPRYCLGAKLAMLEMKTFLAMFARRIPGFQLVGDGVDDTIDWNPQSIIPKPANGVVVEIVGERVTRE